ncbi:MAG: hypothetical protein H6735_25105 [Alphaproteobacteria bacterium]|nr:hypothetical protein [Alphaproteobacteria bacterium]
MTANEVRILRAAWYHPAVWMFALFLGSLAGGATFVVGLCAGLDELALILGAVTFASAVGLGVWWRTSPLVLAIEGSTLLVRWRSEQHAFPRDRVLATWTRMGLGFVADTATVIPIIGGATARAAVVAALEDLGVELVQSTAAVDLSSEIREHTLDGMTLRLEPVYAPMPIAVLVVITLTALALVSMIWVGVANLVHAASWASLPYVLVFAGGPTVLVAWMLRAFWSRTTAVEIELSGHRLAVVEESWLGSKRTTLPLAEIEAMVHGRDGLRISTERGRREIRLP